MTPDQTAELAKPVARVVYFVQLDFKSSTSRVSTANVDLTWGGNTWSGIGALGTISAVEESDGLESRPVNLTINAAQPAWLALAVGPADEYRGRKATIYMCPLNEAFQLVGTPERCWSGTMDMVSVGVEGESGSITLKCETAAYGLKRRPSMRLNAAQHKKINPTDTGLDYLNDLISNPGVWLSAQFQRTA